MEAEAKRARSILQAAARDISCSKSGEREYGPLTEGAPANSSRRSTNETIGTSYPARACSRLRARMASSKIQAEHGRPVHGKRNGPREQPLFLQAPRRRQQVGQHDDLRAPVRERASSAAVRLQAKVCLL